MPRNNKQSSVSPTVATHPPLVCGPQKCMPDRSHHLGANLKLCFGFLPLPYENWGISRARDGNPTDPPPLVAHGLSPNASESPSNSQYPWLSRKTVFNLHKRVPFDLCQTKAAIASYFLFAKNLLEPIKQISIAGETVPFLFVIIVVFNLGCSPKVCSMSELLSSAF